LLRPVQEQGSASARYFLGQLKASKPVGSFTSIQKLAKGSTAHVRQQAAEELARLKTPVAVEELVKALDDVALPVREQAAVALGEIGDSRALEPLLNKLSDPASGIEGPAATALGKIGDRAALPSLVAAARLGPLPRQLAAVEALGWFSDARATEVLIELLDIPGLYIPVLRALGDREDPSALPVLVERLDTEHESAALAILADAAGRFGDPTALPGLLSALSHSSSRTVRCEVLNAIGSVIGGRDSFYPYLAMDEDARDETVTKTLINIEKRLRAQARRGTGGSSAARRAIRARQALAAFAADDMPGTLHRLAQLAQIPPTYHAEREGLAVQVLSEMDRAARSNLREVEPEEALLAVFLARLLTDARAPVGEE
jgi:HEAT repeat protein